MNNSLPLSDVKILDLMWVMAGPAGTRVLADYGATVVRVDSQRRIDTARTLQPFLNRKPGPDNSALFQNLNAGKYGLSVDLTKEAGRGVIRDLVQWADVVTESFSPRAMKGWGLDYQSLRQLKPDIIMISSCLMGQTGPWARFAGFGNLAAAISGFFNLVSWPDRPPAGPFSAYTDYVSPRFTAISILAALEHRRRTGQGQYIDQSQAEASLHFLGPALLDYTVNGRVQGGRGNRDLDLAPHGIYPALGEDRWLALVVQTEEQWRALCTLMNKPELLDDPRFATTEARLAHQDPLDEIVSAWTRTHDRFVAEELLQSRGVSAGAVRSLYEMEKDPQLQHRKHFVQLDHATLGPVTVEGSRFRMSRTPAVVERSAPTWGRDNQYVLEQILGYSEEKITELIVAEALE
ncbi:MAG: CoA transferase [Deltaproteobacteria bacterium]|nr:CoA transferase [Deltaproteobacteria bacterium]